MLFNKFSYFSFKSCAFYDRIIENSKKRLNNKYSEFCVECNKWLKSDKKESDNIRLIIFLIALFVGLLGLLFAPLWVVCLVISYFLFQLAGTKVAQA